MIICDTSGLLALADGDDPAHHRVAGAFKETEPPFVISPLVLAEVDHLLRVRGGAANARAAVRSFTVGGFTTAALTPSEIRRAVDIDEQYADLGLGLTDCTLVVLAARHNTLDLLTLDERHFRAVTPLHGDAFRLLPSDAR
ncbi:type II toxin-antitoxin system VapC family toxin [Jiangella asiatica]|uniref:Ribonuclease VapC n=1 Tax=Jiangella asiatica TaxID=2530372 RepID=A0A4R5CE52_9ACTN|nr:PIN domain-containing protein [Jiangella asiatica]TDD97249.1 PIN domain-containing protein [Jiangella asiatica]